MKAAGIAIACALSFLCSPLAAQPAPPHFEISTPNHQAIFYIGERIPLTLAFSGPPATYEIILYNFGRLGGSTMFDTFRISPESGWSDSLGPYYAVTTFGCCGAKQVGVLSATPTTLQVNLNEWARFDQPGTYTVSLTSHRVNLLGDRTSIFSGKRPELPSNLLTIQIIPATPEWQRDTLNRALREIATLPNGYEPYSPQQNAALADLRYLASNDSLPFLAASLKDEYSQPAREAFLGLIGLPRDRREAALTALRHMLDDPTFPITPTFLEAIPWLQINIPAPPPEPVSFDNNERDLDRFRDAALSYQAEYAAKVQPLAIAAWEAVASSLPRKTGPARAVTSQTLAEHRPVAPSPSAAAQLGAILRESFPNLSEAQKMVLLQESWDLLGDRSLVPQLRTLSASTTRSFADRPIAAIALERWYEFEPEAATAEVFHKIGTADPALSADDIAWLPPQGLPQFEMLWANAFVTTNDFRAADNLGSLLVARGTGIAVPRVTQVVTENSLTLGRNWNTPAMAYLVRFAPQTAKRLIEAANVPRQGASYPPYSLWQLAKLVQDPVLTEIALTELERSDDVSIKDALDYLARYGDEKVRKPILDRYLRWAKESPVVPEEQKEEEEPRKPQSDIGSALGAALLNAQGWLPTSDLIAAVMDHCTGKRMCKALSDLAAPDLSIAPWDTYGGSIGHLNTIPTEALFEAKLDQYPKGTTFKIEHITSANPEADRKREQALRRILLKHDLKLEN